MSKPALPWLPTSGIYEFLDIDARALYHALYTNLKDGDPFARSLGAETRPLKGGTETKFS